MGTQPRLERQVDRDPGARERAALAESLSTLYQGVLTGIARVKTGRQHITDGESFRRRTKSALADIGTAAIRTGYDERDIEDAHFAVVAFLDEAVLHSPDPVRADWERRTLQAELFGQTDAGVVFFEKLARLESRPDSIYLAGVLEIYLTCLLLGFEGRYAGSQSPVLDSIAARLTRRIREISPAAPALSPRGIPSGADEGAAAAPRAMERYFTVIVAGSLGFTLLLYLAYYWNLSWLGDGVLSMLGRGG